MRPAKLMLYRIARARETILRYHYFPRYYQNLQRFNLFVRKKETHTLFYHGEIEDAQT